MRPRKGDIIRPNYLLPLWRLKDGRRFGVAFFDRWRLFFIGVYTPEDTATHGRGSEDCAQRRASAVSGGEEGIMNLWSVSHWGMFEEPDSDERANVCVSGDGTLSAVDPTAEVRLVSSPYVLLPAWGQMRDGFDLAPLRGRFLAGQRRTT